jgi:hypothetical protein
MLIKFTPELDFLYISRLPVDAFHDPVGFDKFTTGLQRQWNMARVRQVFAEVSAKHQQYPWYVGLSSWAIQN